MKALPSDTPIVNIQRNTAKNSTICKKYLIFCNYAVRSYGTWHKEPGEFPRNVLSISDLEQYIIERSTGVCGPVTD